MQRKKGFTLVELLVAIVCATLVLSMVTSAVIFLTRMNDGATNESKTLFQLQTIKDFVQQNAESDMTNVPYNLDDCYTVEDGKVLHKTWSDIPNEDNTYSPNEPVVVVENHLIENIEFNEQDETVDGNEVKIFTCTITYDGGQTFVFVAYTQTSTSTSEQPTE